MFGSFNKAFLILKPCQNKECPVWTIICQQVLKDVSVIHLGCNFRHMPPSSLSTLLHACFISAACRSKWVLRKVSHTSYSLLSEILIVTTEDAHVQLGRWRVHRDIQCLYEYPDSMETALRSSLRLPVPACLTISALSFNFVLSPHQNLPLSSVLQSSTRSANVFTLPNAAG